MDYTKAQNYWKEKDVTSTKMDIDFLKNKIEEYINANNTCALATGTDNYIRNTPIEYSYHDGYFWMFSEDGNKFIGLEKNPNVCIAIFDSYSGFGNLNGLQVMGHASIVEPFSEEYKAHASIKGISLSALQKISMYLIKVKPISADFLSSDFKKLGFNARQHFDY